jgi:elongation factor P
MYETSDIRKNLKVEIDGQPYMVIDFQFVKPGKGNAFTRTRLKNMISGSVLDRTFKTGEKLEPAHLEEHNMQYLYHEAGVYHFMNNASYEQCGIVDDKVGDAANFLIENISVDILFFNHEPIGVSLPNFVDIQIVEAEPGVKGDTATGATKTVKLSTGHSIQVPLFVNQGDFITIDTRTGEYYSRAKK